MEMLLILLELIEIYILIRPSQRPARWCHKKLFHEVTMAKISYRWRCKHNEKG